MRKRKLDYQAIQAYKNSGLNIREVAEKFGCSRGAVQYIFGFDYAVNRKKANRYSQPKETTNEVQCLRRDEFRTRSELPDRFKTQNYAYER